MLAPAIVDLLAGFIVLWLAVRMWQGSVARGSAAGVRSVSEHPGVPGASVTGSSR
jgi:hypothetical protein